ncbi:hypothetical protein IFR05_009254 [Cadophora sp. M221]|nr:hypothetical protein IFR05_009254 [Cadophora sp. M221]
MSTQQNQHAQFKDKHEDRDDNPLLSPAYSYTDEDRKPLRHPSDSQQNTRRQNRLQLLYCLALLVTTTSTFFLSLFSIQLKETQSHVLNTPSLGEEINGLIPKYDRNAIQIWNDSSFVIGPDMTAPERARISSNWLSLIPDGHGYLHVDNPSRYILPPPVSMVKPHDNVQLPPAWALSVFHQIHCLHSILESYTNMYFDSIVPENKRSKHVYHCFDYLRQILMCSGDTSLEGQDPFHEPGETAGYGTTHMCKDYSQIVEGAKRSWAEYEELAFRKSKSTKL